MTPKNTPLAYAASLLVSVSLIACATPGDNGDATMIKQLSADISYLASDSLEGRETGTEGEAKAAAYIAQRFEELGLQKAGDGDSYFQQFSFKPHPPVTKHTKGDSTVLGTGYVKERVGQNVVGMLDKGASKTIVIGAHYDHLGYGDENSLFTGGKEIHNGADDNASGVAAMLDLADRFQETALESNILFIAFSGEEKGLYGSNYFVDNPTISLEEVNYMINMDMVGRMKEDSTVAVYGTGTSPSWPDAVSMTNTDSLDIVFHESGVGPSDHTSFYLADLPVLHFFTGQHEDYHKPTDDADKINYEGMQLVIDFIERIILELDDDGKLAFTKTKDQDKDSTPRFNVTLGVVPDYMYSEKGMRIDGVSEERPAHTAGIIAGDVVIRMGDHPVNDMQGYMEGLSMFNEGDTTVVTVLRNGEEKAFDVIWD